MSTDPNNPSLADCTVLGANGFPFAIGTRINLSFDANNVHCTNAARIASFSLAELAELNISGPGSVSSGGGFIGGGFGVDGALEGMAVATVLNLLTTKTKVHTFLTLIANFGELHLHYAGMEPSALRMALAPVYVRLRRLDPVWQESRLKILATQHSAGLLTDDDLSAAKKRLLVSSDWKDPILEAAELQHLHQAALDGGPKGQCPNCNNIIPLHADTCPKCKAVFGVGSAWKVLPV